MYQISLYFNFFHLASFVDSIEDWNISRHAIYGDHFGYNFNKTNDQPIDNDQSCIFECSKNVYKVGKKSKDTCKK